MFYTENEKKKKKQKNVEKKWMMCRTDEEWIKHTNKHTNNNQTRWGKRNLNLCVKYELDSHDAHNISNREAKTTGKT